MKRFLSTAKFLSETKPYLATTYARPDIVLAKGKGSRLWDTDGNEYVDFTAGIAVTALGHSNPEIADIMFDQAKTLVHSSNLYFNEWTPRLSENMVETTKRLGGMQDAARLFVCNSGSEANEAALKFARRVNGREGFLAFKGGFHGRTYGALSATCNPKYQAPFAPMVPGFEYGVLNEPSALDLITENTSAVIVEPIQGEGGVNVADTDWLIGVRNKCNEVGALLIFDEIQCGLGRTGHLWAHQALPKESHPDIVSMAKALGNGFPIGATMISEKVNQALKVGDHGTTYGGNPLGCRIGDFVLAQVSSPELLANVAERSEQIKARVAEWQKKFDFISEVRGRGLLLGIQLTKAPDAIVAHARDNGLLIITCGTNTLRLVPALNISKEDTDAGLDVLEKAFTETA